MTLVSDAARTIPARDLWHEARKGRFFRNQLTQLEYSCILSEGLIFLTTHSLAAPRHNYLLDSISTTALSKLSLPAAPWHMDVEGQYVLPTLKKYKDHVLACSS